jgi:hypothetical protein
MGVARLDPIKGPFFYFLYFGSFLFFFFFFLSFYANSIGIQLLNCLTVIFFFSFAAPRGRHENSIGNEPDPFFSILVAERQTRRCWFPLEFADNIKDLFIFTPTSSSSSFNILKGKKGGKYHAAYY